MTELKFQYDTRLLERCVKSSLYASVVLAPQQMRTPMLHEEELRLQADLRRAEKLSNENHLEDADDPSSCVTLFHEHQRHFRRITTRRTPSEEDEEEEPSDFVSVSSYLYKNLEEGDQLQPSTGRRFEAFLENAGFVYHHNQNSSSYQHRVSLNRFSDMRPNEIFSTMNNEARDNRRYLRHFEEEDENSDAFDRALLEQLIREGVVTRLDDLESILSVAMEGVGKGSMNRMKTKKYKKFYHQSKTLTLDSDAPVRQFQTPEVEENLKGAVLSIRLQQQRSSNRHEDHHVDYDDDDDDDKAPSGNKKNKMNPPPSINPVPVVEEPVDEYEDIFARNLNWATTENPDGVAIVHESFDQGTCGACWAFAATGSLEASASRRSAYNAYKTYMRTHPFATSTVDNGRDNLSNENVSHATVVEHHPAIAFAQRIQNESFHRLNLSIQELIDCDTSGDQGCTGGNPLLSFYFIHRYGLTTWDKYPYVGHQETCHEHLIKQPIATVKSWGIISPNHETHMELVLRHIGPIAVGVNGASASFLAYSGGIYDNPSCRQGANHALLITGYGDEVVDGKIVRFWHARNSWGTGWGESGYVRIKRNDGLKGSLGVCGIARSPSVALGGILIPTRGETLEDDAMSSILATRGPMERLCYRIGLGFSSTCLTTTSWLDDHKVFALATIGVLLGIMSSYLLTYDIRRRRRRRNERRRRRLSAGSHEAESSSLLASAPNGHASYGSGE